MIRHTTCFVAIYSIYKDCYLEPFFVVDCPAFNCPNNCLSTSNMQLLSMLFLVSVQLLVSNAQAVVSVCQIMPIVANNINNLVPCGYGSLTFGCVCCGGETGCLSPIETCTVDPNSHIHYCVRSPGYTIPPSCAAQGLATCGNYCLPIGGSCCPSKTQYCPAGSSCDSQNKCVENSPLPTPSTKSTTTSTSTTSAKIATSLTTTIGNQATLLSSESIAGTTSSASIKSTPSLTTEKGTQVTGSSSGSLLGTTTTHTSAIGTSAGPQTVSSVCTFP